MAQLTNQAIGIDLGTTYCAVARLDERGRPVTVPNAEGDLTTPSVVLIDGEEIVVGKEAVKALASEPGRVAECPKRDMGERWFHRAVDGVQYAPEVLQAFILRKLVRDASRQFGPITHAVITVPAYFDEVRRKATQDAGYMAGLDVLDIINEPTAAAVAFGFQQGFLTKGGVTKPQTILVYDLGGGTFDVTVMRIEGEQFTTLSTDGDVRLGGRDWDQRLVDHVAEEFVRQHDADPRDDAGSLGRLWRNCEDAKRTLSARQKSTITCEYLGQLISLEVTRESFADLTHDLLDRTRFTTRQAMQAAGLEWDAVDRVLLVGGSTRMPMVQAMLQELSGKDPDTSISADEAVAQGAALRAGWIIAEATGQPPPCQIQNVNSHSLGVVGVDKATGRARNVAVIPRNSRLPIAARRRFKTQHAGQQTVLVQVIEGEAADPADCTPIGQCVIRNLPADLPAGSPIDIRFRYSADGRLTVKAAVADGAARIKHEIARANGLGQELLDGWRTRITATEI